MGFFLSKAKLKKGALSRQLRIPEKNNIPVKVLDRVMKAPLGSKVKTNGHTVPVTPLLKKRANLAKTLKRLGK